ncbi:glycosyltransferase family 2 protein [Treponema denticola]|uniref:Glycosyltransferase family 2 protein n=1 Tax=Treponema denticola TaxID=158 RepID=A0A9Q9BMZ4_TREDN|nr:glycosyltransferase family 2 protein [Treponema denticola]UTC90756.1 glycosyltransferase family 2 protein [Treponema denticola]UTC99892.1 glycosyltransferase family 2 protein [Treponema denticola]
MKFTIVIPIFNRVQYIPETLDSVIRQTYTDLEIICVDDCSSDRSPVLLQDYAKTDLRIKVLTHAKNKGLYLARKTGVLNASGDYILFLDCDDVLALHAVEVIYNALCKNSVEVLEYGYHSIHANENTVPDSAITVDKLFSSLVYDRYPRAGTVWNKAYKTELLKNAFSKMSDFHAVMGEDFYESVIIAYYAKSYSSIDDVLVIYNDESGISNTRKNLASIQKDLDSVVAILNGFRFFFESYASEHKAAVLNIERYYVHYVYYNLILLRTNKTDRLPAVHLLKDYFSAEAVAPFLKKTKSMVARDAVLYNIRAVIKKFIPKMLRERIKKIVC